MATTSVTVISGEDAYRLYEAGLLWYYVPHAKDAPMKLVPGEDLPPTLAEVRHGFLFYWADEDDDSGSS